MGMKYSKREHKAFCCKHYLPALPHVIDSGQLHTLNERSMLAAVLNDLNLNLA